jgi:hypothetical protein
MSYQADIYAAVLASGTISELIGDRFSWDIADADTLAPYIVAQTISDDGETPLDGTRELAFPSIQFACWASTKAEAIAIMAAWKTEMEGIDLPGDAGVSLGFSSQNSSYDTATRLFGEICDYKASCKLT